ncbi:MAG TPA: PD-(D/E)XK nuclease family protein [Acidobacteriaceae bacterium]|nr:PD-(D/E)XK nuclease family protein [Acidobacteriaceae bacterium]
MPSQPPLHTAVFAAMDSGALVLTANQRAARTLHTAYARRMRAEGKTLWQPPPISTWESWTSTLWQQLVLRGTETRVLLSPMQERLLWKKILAADAAASTLRSPESLASLAVDAWSLLSRFGGLDANGGLSRLRAQFETASTDTRIFLRWAQQFERRCRKDLFLPAAQLDAALVSHIAQQSLSIEAATIVLVGFDRMTPAQTKLCETLRESGIAVSTLASGHEQPSIRIAETADEDSEMRFAAHAIRQRLTSGPQARIAVIVPDLASVRSRLERVFLGELSPELLIAGARTQRPFEFSLGVTLNRIAMTRAAMSLLRWTVNPLPLEEVSALILSPYLAGSQSERYARAAWDAQQLRKAKLLEPEIPLAWMLRQPHLPPMLHAQLGVLQKLAMDAVRQRKTAPASYSGWMEHAAALLAAAGWPGASARDDERPLDSTEFQLQDRWQEMLDEITTLDFTGERVDFATALAAIERAAAETLFAPQSHNAPVQIMGALESAGSTFDSIWFLGATDMKWPAAARTHPFIPWTVQRDLAMPGSDTSRTLAECIAVTQRIAASAPEITFSFARHGSEGEQRASTCLHSLDGAEWLSAAGAEPAAETAILLEDVADDLALPPLPTGIVRGGAHILELQAQCPFRAYAERRLASTALDAAEPGFDAAMRGSLIHLVMAKFWGAVKTQRALVAMTPEERSKHLDAAIQTALTPVRTESEWDRRYLQIQRDWLARMLPQWLEVERTRPPFEVIATERELREQHIGSLSINVRVDRIDRVESKPGEPDEVILDYKTGDVSRSAWFEDRIEQPQLPLYAVLTSSPEQPDHARLTGIAFAKLRTGKMGMDGISSQPHQIKKTRMKKDGTPYANSEVRDLEYEIELWRKKLTALAEEFAAGHSAVTPKHYPKTCEYCSQMPLCRIQENAARTGIEEGLDD